MFPTANSVVYYNQEGEVLGWDVIREPDAWGADDDYYADYDEDVDPEDCNHDDVSQIVAADGVAQGVCDLCVESVTRLDGDGSWNLSRWS